MLITYRNTMAFLLDMAVLVLMFAFVFCYIPPALFTWDTITTGGDTASHYYTAWYLKHALLPKGDITGWTMGNLGGFPMLQNYFPLPFLLIVALSYLMPLEIAYKLVTVLGIFLLPLCTYVFFRLLKQPSPVPVTGAIATIPFLFMEGNSIWGANIPTTLAGPFCYSIGFSLTILWLGLLYESFNTNKNFVRCGILLAIIGFCHGYALLYAGFASLFFLIDPRKTGVHLKQLMVIHGTAIGLMAFWLFPMIAYMPFTTKFGFVWIFSDLSQIMREIFPAVIRPFIILSFIAPPALFFLYKSNNTSVPLKPVTYLFFLALCGLCLYFTGYRMNLVDVRFLPFFQFFIVIGGVVVFTPFAHTGKTRFFATLLFLLTTLLWTDTHETSIKTWAEHNYKGFESMPLWGNFSEVNDFLKGTENDPRVVYEHSSRHGLAGSVRAFESLPFFSGRSTLEGVYIQGSLNVPYIFYIQAEISKTPSMPLADYVYPAFNLDRAAEHLKLYNISHSVFIHPDTVAAANSHPEYTHVFQSGPYHVFKLHNNKNRYVVPLEHTPAMMTNGNYKHLFYRWFRKSDLTIPIAYIKRPKAQDTERFVPISPAMTDSPPKVPLQLPDQTLSETLTENEIRINGATPGHPLLVKVSWHPNWKTEGADTVYMVSPGFMLIFPTSAEVRLYYGKSLPEYTGMAVSFFVIALLCLLLCFPVSSFFSPVSSVYDTLTKTVIPVLSLSILACFAACLFLVTPEYPVSRYNEGLKFYTNKQYEKAKERFRSVSLKHQDTIISDEALYHYAMCYYLEEKWVSAMDILTQLIRDYPETRRYPEAVYHLALCCKNLGKSDIAFNYLKKLTQTHPDSIWAEYADTLLKEFDINDI